MLPIAQVKTPASLPTDRLRWISSRSRLLVGAWILSLLPLATAGQNPPPKTKSIQELKAFFQQNCARCHGVDGSAKTSDGKPLGGLDFTKAAKDFRTLSGPASEREIRTMIRTIQKGIFFGLTMPAWKDQLSREDATAMVQDILLKAEAGKTIAPGAEPVASPR